MESMSAGEWMSFEGESLLTIRGHRKTKALRFFISDILEISLLKRKYAYLPLNANSLSFIGTFEFSFLSNSTKNEDKHSEKAQFRI